MIGEDEDIGSREALLLAKMKHILFESSGSLLKKLAYYCNYSTYSRTTGMPHVMPFCTLFSRDASQTRLVRYVDFLVDGIVVRSTVVSYITVRSVSRRAYGRVAVCTYL